MARRAASIGVLLASTSVGAFVACSDDSSARGVEVSTSSNPANVSIDLRDASGQHVGACNGILVSPTAVLTAGHCVAHAKHWVVTAPGASTPVASGARVFTTWRDFDSLWSHPRHSDVAVILLDRPVHVPSYPTIATSIAPDGDRLSRVRRAQQGAFEEVAAPVYRGAWYGMPLDYAAERTPGERVDTGGALLGSSGDVVYGVVSGKGLTSGRAYVARVDYLASWIRAIAACSPPPMRVMCGCHDAGSNHDGGAPPPSDDGGTCNPPPPPPPPEGDSGGGTPGDDSGPPGFDGGRVDGGINLVPDGPGCIDPNCGGCGNDPNCNDDEIDYGDCGCSPPPPVEHEAGPIF